MTASTEVILVVVHPAHDLHLALERALVSASLRDVPPRIHLFISPDVELMTKSERMEGVSMSGTEIEALFDSLQEKDIAHEYSCCWTRDIEGSILKAAEKCGASMIMYPFQGKAVRKHQWFTSAKWDLLRNSTCPVMLVKPDSAPARKQILAAVNFQSPYPEYVELNKRILTRGNWLAEKYGASLTVVNAYEDMSDYPDVEKIKKGSGLTSDRVKIESGDPDDVVAMVAEQIKADLVLIGTRNTHDISSQYRGNTAEKVVERVHSDVLVIA